MYKITMKTEKFEKVGTQWKINPTQTETKIIPEEWYKNMVNSKGFFRNLGGYERHEKSYTCHGYIVSRIISISPDRKNKSVYSYNFEYMRG